MSSRRVTLPVAFLMLASGGLAACDYDNPDDYEDGHFYCTDANGVVVDEDECDEASPNYNSSSFIWWGGSSVHQPPAGHGTYPIGSQLPSTGQKFAVTDTAARSKFGLPAGRVSNGTVKTGVVGKGGAGSTAVKGGGTGGGGGKSSGG